MVDKNKVALRILILLKGEEMAGYVKVE